MPGLHRISRGRRTARIVRALAALAAGVLAVVEPAAAGDAAAAGAGPAAAQPLYVAAPHAPPSDRLRVRLARVDVGAPLPEDLVHPEGRSRWDLRRLTLQERWERAIEPQDGGYVVTDGADPAAARLYRDAGGNAGRDAALRYALPHRAGEPLRPGDRARLVVEESGAGPDAAGGAGRPATATLLIEATIAGIGWVDLPSGPREVVLERLLVRRRAAGTRGYLPESLVHRFIDPRAGVVAQISGPPTEDGRERAAVDGAAVLEAVVQGAADLRIYLEDLWGSVLTDINFSRDRGNGTTIASMTPAPGVTTAGDLIALSSWDFSGNTTGNEVAFTATTVSQASTCNHAQCGYTVADGQLERNDRNWNVPGGLVKVNDVAQLEVRATDTVIWLRAGSQKEGVAGAFGSGESRFCYTTFGGTTRTPVPLWILSNHGVPGGPHYVTAGDSWSSAPFNCEPNVFNQICGALNPPFDAFRIKACGTHTGTQFGTALKGGVVTLPSGHTFNALLTRNVADFCVYLISSVNCAQLYKLDEVRTVNYLWQVPQVGTVARLQSAQNVPDTTSFTTVAEADVSFGLFPPRSITATASDDSSVDLSWDPGLDTHRITGYKVYWDTDSGASSPYAFDSEGAPGQASIAGTTARISGLTPGTAYHFTVTSLALYTDPSTGIATRYESILYPTQISGDPDFVYPVEVIRATTGGACVPSAEVQNVAVAHDAPGIQICWDPVTDPCLAGYEILGSADAGSDAGFTVVGTTGLATCWTGNPSSQFFLVVAAGTGGTGPWGHYGR